MTIAMNNKPKAMITEGILLSERFVLLMNSVIELLITCHGSVRNVIEPLFTCHGSVRNVIEPLLTCYGAVRNVIELLLTCYGAVRNVIEPLLTCYGAVRNVIKLLLTCHGAVRNSNERLYKAIIHQMKYVHAPTIPTVVVLRTNLLKHNLTPYS
jgi:hypothetical protein